MNWIRLAAAACAGLAVALAAQSVSADPIRMKAPDGTYFTTDADGAARHAPSGLVCPVEVAGFKRGDLAVLDPAEGGTDVLCRFFSGKSWFSVFETRFMNTTLEQVFASYVKEAQGQAGSTPALDPPVQIQSSLPIRSAFWVDDKGSRQGMWVARHGDWYIELRVTWVEGDDAKVAAFAQAMFALLDKTPG
jgi:hypothetical protein